MKTHRALTVYAFVALLCSFLVVRCLLSAPLLKADDTIGLTSADLPRGYRLVADTGFQTREMELVTGTGEKEKHQPYTVHERRQDVALPGQTDADGARISVTMMVFPSVELALAYCEQMEVYVFEGGTLRLDPHWHTSRNDLGDPRLTGKGGAVRSNPTTLLIRYGNVFCQISAGSFNPKCSEVVGLLGKIWLEKISRALAGTVAVEGSMKPEGTGQAVVIDETGSVTQAQIGKLQDGLAQLRDKYGVSIAIVFTGFLSKEAQKERSREYYMRLSREGKLADPAAVCLLWAGEGRTGINWHRDETVDKLLPWEKVEKAWDKAANSKPPGAPLALELIAQLLATPTPSGGEAKMYHLSSGDSSVPLGTPYKAPDGFLRFELRFSEPGSVLDTVGINAAKAGDFAIWILPDNVLVWQIYHPSIASSLRAPNGWHILPSLHLGKWKF